MASFAPSGGFACLIEHDRYFAALSHFGDQTLSTFFGGGRVPLNSMGLVVLFGQGYALRAGRASPHDCLPGAEQAVER